MHYVLLFWQCKGDISAGARVARHSAPIALRVQGPTLALGYGSSPSAYSVREYRSCHSLNLRLLELGRKVSFMNEEGWLSSFEPKPKLDYLRGQRVSDRKLRLYSVACCRRIWDYMIDERSRKAVEVAEEYADGSIDRERLVVVRDEAREVKGILSGPAQTPYQRAANAAFDAIVEDGVDRA